MDSSSHVIKLGVPALNPALRKGWGGGRELEFASLQASQVRGHRQKRHYSTLIFIRKMKTVTTMKCCYSCPKAKVRKQTTTTKNDNYQRGSLKHWRAECKLLQPLKKTLKKMIWKKDCDCHASHVMAATWDFPPTVQND